MKLLSCVMMEGLTIVIRRPWTSSWVFAWMADVSVGRVRLLAIGGGSIGCGLRGSSRVDGLKGDSLTATAPVPSAMLWTVPSREQRERSGQERFYTGGHRTDRGFPRALWPRLVCLTSLNLPRSPELVRLS